MNLDKFSATWRLIRTHAEERIRHHQRVLETAPSIDLVREAQGAIRELRGLLQTFDPPEEKVTLEGQPKARGDY